MITTLSGLTPIALSVSTGALLEGTFSPPMLEDVFVHPQAPPAFLSETRRRFFAPTAGDLRRKKEGELLQTQSGRDYLARLTERPARDLWLKLEDPRIEVPVPTDAFQKQMTALWISLTSAFNTYIEKSAQPSLKEQWDLFSHAIKSSRCIPSQVAYLSDLLDTLEAKKIIDEEEKNRQKRYLALLHSMSQTFDLAKNGGIPYRLSLWSRDPQRDKLDIPGTLYDDLGTQVLMIRLPNREVIGSVVLRLFLEPLPSKEGQKNDLFCLYQFEGTQTGQHWLPAQYLHPPFIEWIQAWMKKLEAKVMATVYLTHLDWRSRLIPVAAPWYAEKMHQKARYFWPHPYAGVLKWPLCSREVMRPMEGASIAMFNPWLWPKLPIPDLHSLDLETGAHPNLRIDDLWRDRIEEWEPVRNFLLREIDPDPPFQPEMFSVDRELVALSTGTGRSAGYALNRYAIDGVTWHHLDAIGVGKTLKARSGDERRDGLLPLEGAQKRFYLTLLLHHTARKYGFRTSLGVAVINRNRLRKGGEKSPGMPQIEASLYELRREQLRLSNLAEVTSLRETLDMVKEKIAKELGVSEMTDKEYLVWLAKTVGEQLAIMTYFGFDHGRIEDTLQLGPWNVSLAAEIFDFDASKLSTPEKAVSRYQNENKISVEGIHELQREWAQGKGDDSWLAILMDFIPGVDFYRTMMRGLYDKWHELEEKGVDPKAEIHQFNERMWNPYMRERRIIIPSHKS